MGKIYGLPEESTKQNKTKLSLVKVIFAIVVLFVIIGGSFISLYFLGYGSKQVDLADVKAWYEERGYEATSPEAISKVFNNEYVYSKQSLVKVYAILSPDDMQLFDESDNFGSYGQSFIVSYYQDGDSRVSTAISYSDWKGRVKNGFFHSTFNSFIDRWISSSSSKIGNDIDYFDKVFYRYYNNFGSCGFSIETDKYDVQDSHDNHVERAHHIMCHYRKGNTSVVMRFFCIDSSVPNDIKSQVDEFCNMFGIVSYNNMSDCVDMKDLREKDKNQ